MMIFHLINILTNYFTKLMKIIQADNIDAASKSLVSILANISKYDRNICRSACKVMATIVRMTYILVNTGAFHIYLHPIFIYIRLPC